MLGDYELFVRIVEAGSLSAAARHLSLSKAVASKRLARLEARLGAKLILRTTRRLSPTPEGLQFYDRASAAIAILRDAEAAISASGSLSEGRLRISAPTSFGRMHIAPHLRPFLEANPNLQLELLLSDSLVDLLAERIDIAVRIGPPPPSTSLQTRLLAPNTRLLCAAPDYITAYGEPFTIADLAGHRLLSAEGQLPWRLDGPDGPITVRGSSHVKTNSSEVVRELALAGVGIALRSTWDVFGELGCGALAPILTGYSGAADVAIYATYPRSDYTQAKVLRFSSYLAELYAPIPPWEMPDR